MAQVPFTIDDRPFEMGNALIEIQRLTLLNQDRSITLRKYSEHLNALLESYFVKDREGLLDAMIRAMRFQRTHGVYGSLSPELEAAFKSDGKDGQGA